jgi:hypothetical protein
MKSIFILTNQIPPDQLPENTVVSLREFEFPESGARYPPRVLAIEALRFAADPVAKIKEKRHRSFRADAIVPADQLPRPDLDRELFPDLANQAFLEAFAGLLFPAREFPVPAAGIAFVTLRDKQFPVPQDHRAPDLDHSHPINLPLFP